MEFSKYEATANDFIMLDYTSARPELSGAQVRELCDRQRGIGADGVILLLPSSSADMRMRIFNSDGSEAEMCGNGIRALYLFALDTGKVSSDEVTVETEAGIKKVRKVSGRYEGDLFSVEMGQAAWLREDIPMVGEGEAMGVRIDTGDVAPEGELVATCVSFGNPHCVIFVEDVESYPVTDVGPIIENHDLFPERTNVEFVQVMDEENLDARVWERGVGETHACGTGACASLVAANLNRLARKRANISLPGGRLVVEWRRSGVLLTGGARHVFDGKMVNG